MASKMLTQTQQSSAVPAPPGAWKLAAGRAMSLRPREAGVLRVAQGRIWATFDGPHRGPLNDLGDQILDPGDVLRLRGGQGLVIEAWDAQAPAFFSWDWLPDPTPRAAPRIAAVDQPLADLRAALVLGASAAARLAAALGGLAWDLLAGHSRERRAKRAFNAPPKACCADGAMG